ncbi:MAG: hypothetical protein AB1696_07000 [Planctomycetota bacterium]
MASNIGCIIRRIHQTLSIEEIEPRVAPATLTINGTAGDDAFLLSDNGNPIDGLAQIIVNGGPAIVFGMNDEVIVNGGDGDDTLTVDFGGENPVPLTGLTYNGEGNSVRAEGDALVLRGGAFANTSYSYTGPNDGVIRLDSSAIVFTGLEPIVDLVPAASLTIYATDAANVITMDDGSAAADGRLRVSIDAFEPIEFANKTNVTINAGDGAAGGDLGDAITINCTETATGLATVTVNGQEGNDSIALLSAPPGPTISLNGDTGNDIISIAAVPLGLVIDGGGGVDTFEINTGAGDDTITVSIDMEQVDVNGTVVDFLNIATVEIFDGSGDDTLNYDNSFAGQLVLYGPDNGSIADLSGPFIPSVRYWDMEHVFSLSSLFRLIVDANADPAPGSQMNDGIADTFLVSLDVTGTDLEVYVNSVYVHSGPMSQYSQFLCLGSTDDDTLVVDSANGLIVLPQYVSIEGFGGSNTLILQGDPGVPILRETYQSGPSIGLGAEDGNIIFDPDDNAGPFPNLFNLNGDEQVIRFFGLSPIIDTIPAMQLDIFGTPGMDTVDVADGAGAGAGGFTTTRISHVGNLFESIEFANKTVVTFNAMDSMDEFIVNNPNPAGGLTVLDLYGNELTGGTVNPDDDQNELFLVNAMGGTVTLRLFGQGGDDHFGLGEWAGLLDNIRGPMEVVGGETGEINGDEWFLVDRDSLIDDLITFTDSSITGASSAPIAYSEIEDLFFDAANWANVTLDILSSPAGMFSFIEMTYDSYIGITTVGNTTADFGDGTGDLSAILGQVQLDFTFTGYGILQIDDTGDTAGNVGTITDVGPGVVIAGLSPTAITYADAPGPFGGDLDEFALMIGSGNDTVIVNDVTALVSTTMDVGAGDDLLRMDFTSGVPNLPMTFHGGTGSDSMELLAGTADLVAYTFANANNGEVRVSFVANTSTITFTGLEPIVDRLVATDLEFTFPDTADVITLSDDATPNDNYCEISSVASSETVTFRSPDPLGLLIVNGDDLGAGNDAIAVGPLDAQLFAQVIIDGRDGDDSILVNPSPNSPITVDGGNGVDTFTYFGPGTPPPGFPPDPNGAWTQAGFRDVTVANCEAGIPGGVVLSRQNPRHIFTDADGDRIFLIFRGLGQAAVTVLDGSDIVSVAFAGTDARTMFMVKDLDPLDTPNTMTAGTMQTAGGESLGTIRFLNRLGVVQDTGITVGGDLTFLQIVGAADTINVNVAGDLTKFMNLGGVSNTFVGPGGDMGRAIVVGPMDGSAFIVGGTLSLGRVSGAMTNSVFRAANLNYFLAGSLSDSYAIGTASVGYLFCSGDMTNSQFRSGGDAMTFHVNGTVTGGPLAGNTMEVGGNIARILVTMGVNGATVNVTGTTGMLKVIGGLAGGTTVMLGGNVSQALMLAGIGTPGVEAGSTVTLGRDLTRAILVCGEMAGVIDIVRSARKTGITIVGDLTGDLLAGVFGDVTVAGVFSGNIGDGGTGGGVDNTLRVGKTVGGLVTPINAFNRHIGYP